MTQCGKHHDRWVPWFAGFTEFTPTIPKMYWDVESQEQRIHSICKQLHKLVCYADMLGDRISINREDIDELQTLFKQFMKSGFVDYYADQIEQWINDHMPDLISQSVKMVFFGVGDDGYFRAYIPDSWNEIQFDTGYNYSDMNTYGRLILDMYVTDTFKVNGKPTNLIWEVDNND